MNKVIRALAAAGAIAVVPLGLAAPAHASTQNHNSGYGWVTVCQKVYDYQYGNDYSINWIRFWSLRNECY